MKRSGLGDQVHKVSAGFEAGEGIVFSAIQRRG
jgi:hypothetical protein